MPNRRHFRGPRRPGEPLSDGAPGGPEAAPRPAAYGDGGAAEGGLAGEGERTGPRRRRRGRGGRGPRPEGAAPADNQSFPAGAGDSRPGLLEGQGGEDGQPGEARRHRRRRGGRNRGAGSQAAAPDPWDTPEGELPADYIAIPVERGTPLLYQAQEQQALAPIEYEEDVPRAPRTAKRINSGKLFWYIRSKSYVPIPELRRRFEIGPDEMGTIQDDGRKVYVGLPQDVADAVANLRRQNKIGLECSADFTTPVLIGIYPLSRA